MELDTKKEEKELETKPYQEESQTVEINKEEEKEEGNTSVKKQKSSKNKKKKEKKKRTKKQKLFLVLKIVLTLVILFVIFVFLFFKTSLFQTYKELWVQTAMTTMNHQFLATWFLSDEEIAEIMKRLEVENNENSNSSNITVETSSQDTNITFEKITGSGYVGYVMIIPDASKVKLVDARISRKRSKIKRNCRKI